MPTARAGTPVSPAAAALLDRVRAELAGRTLRERRMFGAVAVLLPEGMAVAVHQDGSLLVRVDREHDAALLTRPGASRPTMGPDRSMGPGWIRVAADALDDDRVLTDWVDQATAALLSRPGRRRR